MRMILDIVYDFLNKNDQGVPFDDIFNHVKEEMKITWLEIFSNKSIKDIENDKIGELYTLLSIDGRFIRNLENKWFLLEKLSFEEAKKIKINVSENVENDSILE